MKKSSKIIYTILIIFLVTITLILASSSFAPFDIVKSKINNLAPDNDLEIFNESGYSRIKLLSIFFIITTLLLIFFHNKIKIYLYEAFSSFKQFFKDLKKYIINIFVEDKYYLILLLIIFLAGIGIRLFFINQPIRHDEAISFVTFARIPLFQSLSDYSTSNNHFLHTFFLHISYLIFGNHEWAIRLPAFFAGILIIAATYLTGRSFYNKNVGLIASAFTAISSPLISYSVNARGYTLITLFFLLSLSLIIYLKNNDNKTGWVIFGFINFLGFFTIPTYLYSYGILLVLVLLIIISEKSKQKRITIFKNSLFSLILTIILTVIAYTPAIIFSNFDTGIVSSAIKSHGILNFLNTLPSSLKIIWLQWTRNIHFSVSILLAIGVLVSLFDIKKSKLKKINLIYPCLIWLIPVLLIQRPTMFERLWLFLLPIFFILGSAGLIFLMKLIFAKLKIKKLLVFIIISLIILSILFGFGYMEIKTKAVYFSEETGVLLDAEEISLYLKDKLEPSDRILLECPSEWPLKYYLDKYGIPFYFLGNDVHNAERLFIIYNHSYCQDIDTILLWNMIDNINDFEKPTLLKEFPYSEIQITHRDISLLIKKIHENFSGKIINIDDLVELKLQLKNGSLDIKIYIIEIFNKNNIYISNLKDSEFINMLYETLLNRQPDENGYNGWLNQLENNVSRKKILEEFLDSEEFCNIIKKYKIIENN